MLNLDIYIKSVTDKMFMNYTFFLYKTTPYKKTGYCTTFTLPEISPSNKSTHDNLQQALVTESEINTFSTSGRNFSHVFLFLLVQLLT